MYVLADQVGLHVHTLYLYMCMLFVSISIYVIMYFQYVLCIPMYVCTYVGVLYTALCPALICVNHL